jgi:hypothetical protein
MNDAVVIAGGAVFSALLGWFFFGPREVRHAELPARVTDPMCGMEVDPKTAVR